MTREAIPPISNTIVSHILRFSFTAQLRENMRESVRFPTSSLVKPERNRRATIRKGSVHS